MAIVPADQLIDWTACGVDGGADARTTIHSTIDATLGNDSSAAETAFQNALNACTPGQAVKVPPGIYRVGGLQQVDNVTLRGSGMYCKSASSHTVGIGTKTFVVPSGLGYTGGIGTQVLVQKRTDRGVWMQGSVTSYVGNDLELDVTSSNGSGTIADWLVSVTVLKMGDAEAAALMFGTNDLAYVTAGTFTTISSGATKGSTSVVVASAALCAVGKLALIDDLNDGTVVHDGPSTANPATEANWVDGRDTLGERARGQIVLITGVSGTTITFEPPLYADYPSSPWMTPYDPEITRAGVEHLTVYATNSGSAADFLIKKGLDCWVHWCGFDFADGDMGNVDWSLRCEVMHCHLYDGFVHTAGTYDGQLGARYKSSSFRFEDNICERQHIGILATWGAAGGSISYNYVLGGYDQNQSAGNRWLPPSILANHGAHPQFILMEGNICPKLQVDAYWGTSGCGFAFRNYLTGFGTSHDPEDTRDAKTTDYNLTQANIALDVWEGQSKFSAVGNILGNNGNWSGRSPVRKDTDGSVGYDNPPNCIVLNKGTEAGAPGTVLTSPVATFIDHMNYDTVTGTLTYDAGIADHTLPTSFAYASQPDWWPVGEPWPPINPESVPGDLTTITNPAKTRYDTIGFTEDEELVVPPSNVASTRNTRIGVWA